MTLTPGRRLCIVAATLTALLVSLIVLTISTGVSTLDEKVPYCTYYYDSAGTQVYNDPPNSNGCKGVCTEDMDCWDCKTMGNKICGYAGNLGFTCPTGNDNRTPQELDLCPPNSTKETN